MKRLLNTYFNLGIAIFVGVVVIVVILTVVSNRETIAVAYYREIPENRIIRSELKTFERELGIDVKFQPMGYISLQKAIKGLSGRPDYDVIFVDDIWLRECYDRKLLLELTGLVQTNVGEDFGFDGITWDSGRADYVDAILHAEAFAPNKTDEIWLIPHRADVQVLFYNKSMFDDEHVKKAYEQKTGDKLLVPGTWKDYEKVAINMNGLDFKGKPIVGCAETLGTAHLTFEFFASRYWSMPNASGDNTRNFFFADGDTSAVPLFASTAGENAIAHFRRLKSAQCLAPGSLFATHETTKQSFGNGDVALCPQWYTFKADFQKSLKKRGMELGMDMIPGKMTRDGSIRQYPCFGGGALGIAANSKHAKEAWAFIRFFTRASFSESSVKQGAVVPRKSTYSRTEVDSDEGLDTYLKSLDLAVARPRVAHFVEVETIIGDSVMKAIQSPPEATLQILQEAEKKAAAKIRE